MKNFDTPSHARGATLFVDDLPEAADMLFAAVAGSPIARGKLRGVDTSKAEKAKDVVAVFTAKDIPGENQIGGLQPTLHEASIRHDIDIAPTSIFYNFKVITVNPDIRI